MTVQEQADDVVAMLRTHLDSYKGDAPTDAQKIELLNWAQDTVAKKIYHFQARIALTPVADTPEISLRTAAARRVIQPRSVVIAGKRLRNAAGDRYGMWTLNELEKDYPTWMTAASGRPERAAYYNQTLILHQAPTADVVAEGNHFIAGTCYPLKLTTVDMSNQTSELPEEAHKPVNLLAAIRHSMFTVTEEFAWKMLGEMSNHYMGELDILARDNRNTLSSWGSTPDTGATEVMYI